MRSRRWMLVAPCLIVAVATMASTAQAGAPRWYGKPTGALVPFGGNAGLVELGSPEGLQGVSQIKLMTAKLSLCLIKSQESIANPSNALSPGTGEMEEFEAVCEEGTGPGPNEAAPFPCINGEAFEMRGLNLDWPSTLEVGSAKQGKAASRSRRGTAASRKRSHAKAHPSALIRKLPKYYDDFASVSVELSCLKSKQRAEYNGSLKPEVEVGRLTFRGVESGQLEDSAGHRFSLKGDDFFTQKSYKDVRVNSEYHERPNISSLSPNRGPAAGGTEVTVEGSGFLVGTEMKIFFGQTAGRSVDCTSTTQCTVTSPPHAVGKVTVHATVGGARSGADPANRFIFQ